MALYLIGLFEIVLGSNVAVCDMFFVPESPVKRASTIRKQNEINGFFPCIRWFQYSYHCHQEIIYHHPVGKSKSYAKLLPAIQIPQFLEKRVSKKTILPPTVKPKPTRKYAGGDLDTSIKPVHNQVNGVPNSVEKVSMKQPGVI